MHAMSPEMQLSLYPLFFCEDRHESAEVCREGAGVSRAEHAAEVSRWRMKERMKTTSVALVMCLNIGVDPPDVLKISPCARMECWINPLAMQPAKALEAIGKALQAQYERWQPRAKYKTQLDPTVEDVKKLCQSCRRAAKNERVLLHYNGHGVPRPTSNGEIWVFNKSYTQYIPLSVCDLQSWTGNPAIYVFDCGGAGVLVDAFLQLAQQRGGLAKPTPRTAATSSPNGAAADQLGPRVAGDGASAPGAGGGVDRSGVERLAGDAAGRDALGVAAVASRADATMGGAMPLGAGMSEVILLAACGADETLPQSAELPADVFSACLTTPIKIALRWFCSRSVLRRDGVDASLIDKIPGQQNNRKTPLGELNWIFTAVTDTIAWNALPRPLFQRLFRQDLLVASLFRNFLLAERVMRASNCAPVSCPAMPPTYQHPMWHAWDAAVETCLLQMPGLLNGDDGSGGGNGAAAEFAPSPFFTEQLTAFEVWLERGSAKKPPPEQLPIVLQVLLSQSHRLRALVLLGRFLDMGPWAVDLALSVGIFPYVLKLLQTTAPDLRQILVFIWTKILALDASCQADLVKDGGHAYFARFLDAPDTPSEERAMAAFVLSAVCDGHPKGQAACAASGVARICLERLAHAASVGPSGSPLLVRWLCLCLGKLWENARDAQTEAFACGAPEAVASLLGHPTPDARAAAVYALGALVYVPEEGESCVDEDEPGTETSRTTTGESVPSNARGFSSSADVPGTS
jgi:regulator-associated protein of mTOR